MKSLRTFLVFQFICFSFPNFAQTLSGYVSDSKGEPIVGATIYIPKDKKGTITNTYGFYSLTLTKETYNIEYSFVGFEKKVINLNLLEDTSISVRLESVSLAEVEIKDKRNIINEKISSITIPLEQIKKIPAIGGEVDILKALALTPGVSSGTEGSSGLFVRGGTPDQNLILLDDAVVYNPNHLFGFISVFNPDAVKNVEFIKGGFPARYGGRLSSVVDVNMKEGSLEKSKTDIGIGLLSSRLTIERPVIKDKLSIMASIRSSYLTFVLLPTWFIYQKSDNAQYINYWMYDTNIKLNYKIDKTNQIICSFYNGNDFFNTFDKSYNYDESKSSINWGNTTSTIRHNKEISPKLFWKNLLLFSKFKYDFKTFEKQIITNKIFEYDNFSGLNDITLRSSLDFIPNNKNYIKAGIEGTRYNFVPQLKSFSTNDSSLENFTKRSNYKALAAAFFIEDEIKLSDFLKSNIGFRTTSYNVENKTYWSFEPRLSIIAGIKDWHLKAAYSKMQQNIHLLTNSGLGFQNDIWVPSTDKVLPQKSIQWALGLSKYWSAIDLDMSLEAYYKKMSNLIDYKEGSNILKSADDWYKSVEVNGIGWSKGIELFLHKKTGRLNGFLSYTLSKTDRQFLNINLGEKYAFRYDSRHNLNITSNYKLNKKWDVSATWVFKSGEPVTVPVYTIEVPRIDSLLGTNELPIYTKKNNYRLPAYHRADLSVNKKIMTSKNRQKTWSFGVYNLYNRRNVLYIELSNKHEFINGTSQVKYTQSLQAKSLFPIIPFISYSKSW